MHLPPEIVYIIVELASDDPDTLRSCTLVSRGWLAVARTFLLPKLRIYASLYRGRHEVFKNLIASPRTSMPSFRPKSLIMDGFLFQSDRGPDASVHFLRWCASSLSQDSNTTIAQTLFQSLEELEVRYAHISHSEASDANQATSKEQTIPESKLSTIPFPLFQQFTSVTMLKLVHVICDTFDNFWMVIREFAPGLKTLCIGRLTIQGVDLNEHGHPGERMSRGSEVPALVKLDIDFKSDCISELLYNCTPAPNLQSLTCRELLRTNERAIRVVFDLLSAGPNATELIILDENGFYVRSSEASDARTVAYALISPSHVGSPEYPKSSTTRTGVR
ncbi:hypothetical protein VNI00_000569 [Paramarasmius palmivorus]|uniref:F-box domain-containing protein n=1 Tax=Paramarasmius palmivorus TaxID=297713 RepID=A0AAW0EB46_9AGAR